MELNVQDVVAHPISIGLGDENRRLRCFVVIPKNAPLPATGMKLGAAPAGQLVGLLPVFRGGEAEPVQNKFLGDLTLTFTPSLSPTLLRFELMLDKNGILNVDGAEIDLNDVSPSALQYLSDDDIARLKIKRRTRVELKMRD